MRIGITCTTIEPMITEGQIDGIGTYTQNLYHTLIKQQQNVTPLSFPNKKTALTSRLPGGKFFKFSYTLSTMASLFNPTAFSVHDHLMKNIDILHVTDHMLPKVKKTPIVATICDAIMFNNSKWHWDTIRLGNLKKWVRKKTIHWADHFITISQAMVPELVEYIGIKPEKISVIYLGVTQEWFEKIPEISKKHVLQKYALPDKFLLFTGTLQHKKNLPRIIQAFLQLPTDIKDEYPLVVVGRPGWGTDESLAAIEKLTTAKKGIWLNYIDIHDLRTLFQCASLYVHPSLHEGFGLTLLEAFASGTPTLTSTVTALPEIAGNAAFLVDPFSIDEISQGIINILTSPTIKEELVVKGLARAREFSWEKCAQETVKIYQQLM